MLQASGKTVFIHCFTGRERHIFKERSDYENSRLLTELPVVNPTKLAPIRDR